MQETNPLDLRLVKDVCPSRIGLFGTIVTNVMKWNKALKFLRAYRNIDPHAIIIRWSNEATRRKTPGFVIATKTHVRTRMWHINTRITTFVEEAPVKGTSTWG